MPPKKNQTKKLDKPSNEYNDGKEGMKVENHDPNFLPSSGDRNRPHLIQQQELNSLIRDLNLSVRQAELLGSRLQERNLLAPNTKISIQRK